MKYKLPPKKILELRDIEHSLNTPPIKYDRRIQVVMPSTVVEALDEVFPNVDRSKLLTQLALRAIMLELEYSDDPDLKAWVEEQDFDGVAMEKYLSEREKTDD